MSSSNTPDTIGPEEDAEDSKDTQDAGVIDDGSDVDTASQDIAGPQTPHPSKEALSIEELIHTVLAQLIRETLTQKRQTGHVDVYTHRPASELRFHPDVHARLIAGDRLAVRRLLEKLKRTAYDA